MPLGPIELLEVKFPGNQFTGEIAPALAELVEDGLIRVIDIVFVGKDADGTVTNFELSDLDDDTYAAFDPIVDEIAGLLSEDDLQAVAATLENNTSIGLLLFENVWAARFAEAIRQAKGEVVLNERIPRAVIETLMAARIVASSGH